MLHFIWSAVVVLQPCLVSIVALKDGLKAGEAKERPLVDPNVQVTLWESCQGYPDGTPCEKRCIDITCDHRMARCYKVTFRSRILVHTKDKLFV